MICELYIYKTNITVVVVGDIFWKENATMTDNRMDQISVFANKLKGRFRFFQLNFMNGYLLDKTIF